MKMRIVTIALTILFVIKVGFYHALIPLIIYGFCLVGLFKKTRWSAILILVVSIISTVFDFYSLSLTRFNIYAIEGFLILDIPSVILAFLFYHFLRLSKKK